MDRSDEIRFGQEGLLLGAGTAPRPAGLLGPGPPRNPYPVYGEGDGVGIGSASEDASGRGRCCGASLGQPSARSSRAAPLLTGSAFEGAEPSRRDALADPSASPAPVFSPAGPSDWMPPRPPAPGDPGIARSLFSVPPDCGDAPCEDIVRPRDWMVQFVRTGATWPALRGS